MVYDIAGARNNTYKTYEGYPKLLFIFSAAVVLRYVVYPRPSFPSQSLLQHNALNIDDVVARLQHYRKTCPVYVLNRST